MKDELLDATVDGWRVVAKIGQGATGSVYEARRDGERAALKVIRPEVVSPDSVSRFRREAELLRAIDHPHVVRCLGHGENEDFLWLALDYLDGGSLDRQLRRRGKLTPAEAVHVTRSLLKGLAAIHEQGIVHRDIKPGNLLLGSDGEVRLGDFNLARSDTLSEHDVTAAGAVVGTPFYMAPEQVDGKELSPRTDLYAVGGVLFHLVAGHPPYEGSTPLQVLQKHMREEVPDLLATDPEAPPELAAAVTALMAKRPKDRPKDAAAALALLAGLEATPLRLVAARPRARTTQRRTTIGSSVLGGERAAAALAASAPAEQDEAPAEAEPEEPAGPKPLPRVPRSLLLDVLVAVLVFVAALQLGDAWARRRGTDLLAQQRDVFLRMRLEASQDWKRHLHPVGVGVFRGLEVGRDALDRWYVAVPWSFLLVALLVDLLFARVGRMGLMARLWLRRKARILAGRGEIGAAAAVYEQLGKRKVGADLLLAHGMPGQAAELYAAAALRHEQGDALLAAGKEADAIAAYRAAGTPEATLEAVRLGDTSPEGARQLAEAGLLDEAVERLRGSGKHLEAGLLLEAADRADEAVADYEAGYERQTNHDWWKACQEEVPLEEAKLDLARRIARLHAERGDVGASGRFLERAGELTEALEAFVEAGDAEAQVRCLLALLPPGQRPSERLAAIALGVADAIERSGNPDGVDLLTRLGEFGRAADLARELGDLPQAAQLFARAGRHRDGAACAERAGNRQLAAFLYDEGGLHREAAGLYHELGLLDEAAEAARKGGEHRVEAGLREQLGDWLGAARAHAALGNQEEALDLLIRVQEADGEERWRAARALAGELHHRAGRWDVAIEAFADGTYATVEEPDDVQPNLLFAECLARVGRVSEAHAVLDRFEGSPLRPADLDDRRAGLEALAPQVAPPPAARGGRPRRAPAVEAPEQLEGQALGAWRIDRLRRAGLVAWHYEAAASDGAVGVLSVLKPDLYGSGADGAFLEDAERLGTLTTRHVERLLDVGVADGLAFRVCELPGGHDVGQIARAEAPVPVRRGCLIGAGLCNGLAAAHRAGLTHQALAPSRVFVGRGSAAKVVELGFARAMGVAGLTAREVLDPRYVAPEQAADGRVGGAADVYVAALLIYKLLTGKLPFSSKTPAGFWPLHAKAPPTPIEGLRSDVPPDLSDAIMAALEKDPRARPDAVGLERAFAAHLR